jgi:hypothetical protein
MKKFLILGFVLLGIFALTGCPDPVGGNDVVIDDPIIDPIPIPDTFNDIIAGKFWQVDGIEKYQDTRSAARFSENPYRKDICMYFGEDGFITFWEDANDDGLLSPSEKINGDIPWSVVGNAVDIDGDLYDLSYFNATGWAIEADATGTTLGDWLGGPDDDYEGWVRIHYVPCLLVWDGDVLEAQFAFVFDDMGDTVAEWTRWCKRRWNLEIDFDWADGFYFTSGTPLTSYADDDPVLGNHIVIIDYHDGRGDDIDSLVLIYTEVYGPMLFNSRKGFKPDHVYDMTITVDSADVALFAFVSRVDGSNFEIDAVLDRSEMGELIIRGVDDADVPVVNPTL